MTEPTDKQLEDFAVEEQFLLFCDADEFTQIARAVLAKWGAPPVVREPLTCEWAHNEDGGFWDTECGQSWRFDDGGPKENHMNFCHCCGKPLRIKGGQHGTE